MQEQELRRQLLHSYRRLDELGLNRGTSGNAAVRCGDGMLVTPSALPVAAMTPESMVKMDLDGNVLEGGKPTSEWRIHRDIFRSRLDAGAVLHTHATFATTLACLRRDVPAVHYMIAIAGGDSVRCAPYSIVGGQGLSDNALEALHDRKACLLANHGMVALGRDLEDALTVAVEIESVCEVYWRTLQVGGGHILTAQQMHEVKLKFTEYKKQE